MCREYGGYLPLELSRGQEFYDGQDVLALNSGRYAIVYALREGGWEGIWLPYYICSTVEEAIRRLIPQMAIHYYHIDEHLLPMNVSPKKKECVLWVNYFGIQSEQQIDYMVQRYRRHLILDQTQSFFSEPREDAWQVYSCRKFFGVCDGSYLIRKGLPRRPLKQQYSSTFSMHLLESYEHGTNYSYTLNKENERRLDDCEPELMSPLTQAILQGTDYSFVRSRRLTNMRKLHDILAPYNQLELPVVTSAMNYPFLCSDGSLRGELISRKIYVPQLWKETAENPDASSWERNLSKFLCALPVDQRYDEEDMEFIGKTVIELMEERR